MRNLLFPLYNVANRASALRVYCRLFTFNLFASRWNGHIKIRIGSKRQMKFISTFSLSFFSNDLIVPLFFFDYLLLKVVLKLWHMVRSRFAFMVFGFPLSQSILKMIVSLNIMMAAIIDRLKLIVWFFGISSILFSTGG